MLELKYFEVGDVLDVATELVNDLDTGERQATQSDFDSF